MSDQPEFEIIEGMPFEDYLKVPALNKSTLWPFRRSALYGAAKAERASEDTDATSRGTAFHQLVEDGGKWTNLVEHTETKSATTKAYQEHAATLPPGKSLVLSEDADRLRHMYEAFKSHPICHKVLSEASKAEHVLVWTEPLLGGVRCKARIDRLWEGIGAVDIKTIRELTEHQIESDTAKYGYHAQAAWYCRAMQVCYGIERPAWLFAWQESSWPYDSIVSGIPHDDIVQGWAELEFCHKRWKAWKETGKRPGLSDERMTLGLPKWAQNENLRPINNPFK
jgi:hypothetical protein